MGTAQISNTLTRIMTGILISVVIGIGADLLIKRTWGRLAQA